jgi:hypothetical protein
MNRRADRWIKRTTIGCVGMLALIAGKANFPSSLGKYPDTRVNTYWLATSSSAYTQLWEGDTAQVVYQTVQGNKIYVHAVAGISGFCDDTDPIGNCYGPGFGPQPG